MQNAPLGEFCITVKPVLSGHSKRTPKIGFQYRLSLNASQKYCRMLQGEHSAILVTFIKLPFSIKTFVLSIFEWLLKTGFTVLLTCIKRKSVLKTNFWVFFLSGRLRQVLLYCDEQARIRLSLFIGKKKCFFDCSCISINRFNRSIPNDFINQTMLWTWSLLLCCCVHLMLFCLNGGIFNLLA